MKDIDKANKSKKKFAAIAMSIESPGGSAVQSSIMGSKIKVLAEQKQVPYYTFAESLAASGGYWLLCTGDKVFANRNSLVGSIGVISMVANFRKLFDEKTKIKRHTFTTSDKLLEQRFDILRKEGITDDMRQFMSHITEETYKVFIDHVKKHRGNKIKYEDYDKVFNADIFLGDEALKYGLIDEFGDLDETMKNLYPDAEIVNFSKVSNWERLQERFKGDTSQQLLNEIKKMIQ